MLCECNKRLEERKNDEKACFVEGDSVKVLSKILQFQPIYEVWGTYKCTECCKFCYRLKLIETEKDLPLPLEFICPEDRLESVTETVDNLQAYTEKFEEYQPELIKV